MSTAAFRQTLRARSGAAEIAMARTAHWLRDVGLPDQETTPIATAVYEAVDNSVRHAYRARTSGSVDLELFCLVGPNGIHRVVASVRDHGAWKPPTSGTAGRGLSAIRRLAQLVELSPSPTGTRVKMISRPVPLAGRADAPGPEEEVGSGRCLGVAGPNTEAHAEVVQGGG